MEDSNDIGSSITEIDIIESVKFNKKKTVTRDILLVDGTFF
jgi:hypothetical protein